MGHKHWITKYALSSGIFILENGEFVEGGYLSKIEPETRQHHFYGRKDWHETEAGAISKANEMRLKKIANLKKQIKALDNLKFGTPA